MSTLTYCPISRQCMACYLHAPMSILEVGCFLSVDKGYIVHREGSVRFKEKGGSRLQQALLERRDLQHSCAMRQNGRCEGQR